MTGRFSHANGVLGLAHAPFNWKYHPGERTIPMLLRDAGYRSTLIGMQHEDLDAASLGYDQVLQVAGNRCVPVAEATERWLLLASPGDAPWFASVGFFETHRMGSRGYPESEYPRRPANAEHVPKYLPNNEASREEMAGFHAAVETMDAAVGRILAAIDSRGLRDQTWVIFTTDHGIAFPGAKSTLSDAGLEVALVMRWPAGFPGGTVCDELVSHVDLLPTLLHALGVTKPPALQGSSYWHALAGRTHPVPDSIFAEKNHHEGHDPLRAVRTDRWKYIRNYRPNTPMSLPSDVIASQTYRSTPECWITPRPAEQLYDLLNDPSESINLAGSPAHSTVLDELRGRLAAWMHQTDDILPAGSLLVDPPPIESSPSGSI